MRFRAPLNVAASILAVLIVAACPALFAQGPTFDAPAASAERIVEPVIVPQNIVRQNYEAHKFLDKQNRILFVAVAALNSADFAVTYSNLQNGGRELNPMVRPFASSTPALALNFAVETAGVVTISYFFHKTGHHKLERVSSYLNIGSAAGAVTYGLLHR